MNTGRVLEQVRTTITRNQTSPAKINTTLNGLNKTPIN